MPAWLPLGILLPFIATVPASAGLVAHWKFDGTPADEVASHPAVWTDGAAASYTTAVGAPSSTSAADLAGDWLTAGTKVEFAGDRPFSISLWLKGDGGQEATVLGDIAADEDFRGWELRAGGTENGSQPGRISLRLNHDYPAQAIQVNAATPVLDGAWHHVAVTYDGSGTAAGVAIHVDGAASATTAALDTLGGAISNGEVWPLAFGTRAAGTDGPFTGALDEVAIFDHALSAAEITGVFQQGVEAITWPVILSSSPLGGETVAALSQAEIVFSFPVTGVDSADLLVNGQPATGLTMLDAKRWRFTFPEPPQGDVHFTWAAGHGITGTNGTAARPTAWSARFAPVLPAPQAAISEFVTRNAGGLEDEDHDTPDWIEIVNPGTAQIDLAGWSLTDDPLLPRRWVLPSITLSPGQRKVMFASGKNRSNPAGTLHTNFKLADDGGYLALTDPAGRIAHVFGAYPRQEANLSFGLAAGTTPADGRSAWRYFTPTPNAAPTSNALSGAMIEAMDWTPRVPAPGESITVTVRLAAGVSQVASPALVYTVMHRSTQISTLRDDGQGADAVAGDNVWSALLPPAAAGEMIRWRAQMNIGGVISRWPVNVSGNTSLPLYEGTVVGGDPGGEALPVYQFFVPNYSFPASVNSAPIDTDGGGRGAFFANGTLYDNVLIRIKGTTSRYLYKRSHRVDFNPGRDFQWSPDFPPQRELNLNSEYNDPSYLRQNQQLWMHRDSGEAGAPHFPVKLLMNGATWQLAFHTYSADSELAEIMGLDPRGALYKQVGTLSTGAGAEKKSRRWEATTDYSDFKNGIASNLSLNSRSRFIHDNTNLPAVINYLAVARIAQETDDVWANMVLHRDSEGTGEWRPIPFDLNLSFGQYFYGGEWDNMTVHGDHDGNKAHPLYGTSTCQVTLYNGNGWNRLYEAVMRNETTREMLLRRMRTLMDRYLGATAAASPVEENFITMGTLIGPYAATDRSMWGLPPNNGAYGLGPGISPAQGLADVRTQFLAPRRTHLYVTHSVNNNGRQTGTRNQDKAGIPDAQPAAPTIVFGTVATRLPNPAEDYVELENPGNDAVDVSDWTLRGAAGEFRFKGGTVIPGDGSLFISPDVVAFRARSTSPTANENRLVVGPYPGRFTPYGETLVLENGDGTVIAQRTLAPDAAAPAVSLEVTEILSSSVHTDNRINGDWWELTNTGIAAIPLGGFSWDDSRGQAGAAVFPTLTLAPGETLIVLDEDDTDEAALFRAVWNLPETVKILTREDFGLPDGFRGLGNGDEVIVFAPGGTEVARAGFASHQAGASRAWFIGGRAIPGNFSAVGRAAAYRSSFSPADVASPGLALPDPESFTEAYDLWAAGFDLWFEDAAADADPDGDGRDNRSEYLFGGNPRSTDQAPGQPMVRDGGDILWTVLRRSDDPAAVYTVQRSGELVTWTTATPAEASRVADPDLPGYERITFRLTPDDTSAFYRMLGN